jgi:hypothetical protein
MNQSTKLIVATLLIACLAVLPLARASADSIGPNFATTGTDAGGGTKIWTDPQNISADDNINASAFAIASGAASNYLNATNFTFSLPTGAEIKGIEVTIGRYASRVGIQDASVYILQNGISAGNNRAYTTTTWPEVETAITYGGPSDLWGLSNWTAEMVNNENFGVTIQVINTGAGNRGAHIDYITARIYYLQALTLSVTNSPVTYTGSPQTAVVEASIPGTVSDVKYNGSSTPPTDAGTYAITADFVPENLIDYSSLNDEPAGNFIIEKATPALSVTNSPVTYNGAPQAAVVTGSVDGTVTDIRYDGSATTPSHADSYAVTADFTPADTTNYDSLDDAQAGYFVIERLSITVTAVTDSKVYDGTILSSGLPMRTGDLAVGDDDINGWSQTFENKNVGTGKSLIPSGSVNDGNGGANYDVNFVPDTSGAISPLAIVVTAVTDSKVYDGTIESSGVPIRTGDLATGDDDTGAWSQSFFDMYVGTGKTLTPSGTVNDGNSGVNYDVTFVPDTSGAITPRSLTITASNQAKTYGDGFTFLGTEFTPAGLVNADTVSSVSLTSEGAQAAATVAGSPYAIVSSDAIGTGLENYDITYLDGQFTVGERPITVTADPQTKVYGDVDPGLAYQITSGSLVSPDVFTGELSRTPGETVAGSPYPITQGSLMLNSNYALIFVGNELSITPRPVEVSVVAQTKVYGDADPTLTYMITSGSLAFTDTFTGALERATGETVAGSPYTIGQGSLGLDDNYALTFVGAGLTITKRPITVTADPRSKLIGTADPTLTYSITSGSLAFSDTFTGTLSRDPGETVGSYAITQGTLALTEDYEITYIGDFLTIRPLQFFMPFVRTP